jgi:hypothetical protein
MLGVCTNNGWAAADTMEQWAKNCFKRGPGAVSDPTSMLGLVAYRGHLPEQLKVKPEKENCGLAVTPVGKTSRLQTLDVSVNKPFQEYLTKQ